MEWNPQTVSLFIIGLLAVIGGIGIIIAITAAAASYLRRVAQDADRQAQRQHDQAVQQTTEGSWIASLNTGNANDLVSADGLRFGNFSKFNLRFGANAMGRAVELCKEAQAGPQGIHIGPGAETLRAMAQVAAAQAQPANNIQPPPPHQPVVQPVGPAAPAQPAAAPAAQLAAGQQQVQAAAAAIAPQPPKGAAAPAQPPKGAAPPAGAAPNPAPPKNPAGP